jgi:hypothetical protein
VSDRVLTYEERSALWDKANRARYEAECADSAYLRSLTPEQLQERSRVQRDMQVSFARKYLRSRFGGES